MSDIWSVGGSDNEGVDQAGAEEWQCSSGSEEEERPRKRAKQSGKSKTKRPRRLCVNDLDSSQPKAEDAAEDDDDLLAAFLSPAAANKAAKPSRKSGKGSQRSPSPLLVDGDWEDLTGTYPTAGAADAVARAAAGGGSSKLKAAAAGSGMQPSPDPVRTAALQQRALREQLAQATHAAEEDDDDDDDAVELLDSDEGAALPSPAGGLDLTRDDNDDAARFVEDLGASQPDAAAAAGAAGGGEQDKLPLMFQAQGHDRKATVKVQRNAPLSQGMERFAQHAAEQGWGRVVKYMFDGDVIAGNETPEDYGMEEDEVIDVYLEA